MEIPELIFEYCSDSVEELILCNLSSNVTNLIKKPFKNATSIYINQCNLGRKIANFNNWFPRMQRLMIYNTKFLNLEIIPAKYRNLVHLSWEYSYNYSNILQHCLESIIKFNPQIESLRLDYDCNANFLFFIHRKLKQLNNLELPICSKDTLIERTVSFNRVNKLSLHLRDPNIFIDFPFEFKYLSEIHLNLLYFGTMSNSLIDFLLQHQLLSTLHVSILIEQYHLTKLFIHLPLLEIVYTCGKSFTRSNILRNA